jgi:hypothetical protein
MTGPRPVPCSRQGLDARWRTARSSGQGEQDAARSFCGGYQAVAMAMSEAFGRKAERPPLPRAATSYGPTSPGLTALCVAICRKQPVGPHLSEIGNESVVTDRRWQAVPRPQGARQHLTECWVSGSGGRAAMAILPRCYPDSSIGDPPCVSTTTGVHDRHRGGTGARLHGPHIGHPGTLRSSR